MAEKSPSPDPKTQSMDPKSPAQASTSSDAASQLPVKASSAEEMSAAKPAGEMNTTHAGAAGDISSESEMAFQRLFDLSDFATLMQTLEVEELEAPNGIPGSIVYERLLATYLLQNDFYNAKLLWKRIPASLKTPDSELMAMWVVGQKVSQSDYSGIYAALRRPWQTHEKLMEKMLEVTRRRAVELVTKAYESIAVDNLTTLLGTSSAEETKQLATELQWGVEDKMIFPKSDVKSRADGGKFKSSDAHLGLLTDYVSFLESH